MASKKKQIIPIDKNKITLPVGLVPKDVTQFSIEAMEDGRLVLSPIPPAAQVPPAPQTSTQKFEKTVSLAEIVDIRLGRKRAKKIEPRKQKQAREGKAEEASSVDDGFVRLHHFSSRLEAEMLGEILRQADIPFLIQSEDIGIFGPGAAPAPGGARLVVRRTDREYAKTLLSGLI